MTAILGISAFCEGLAAALIEDGQIVAAAQEERFSRKKHDARFPANAIRYCLTERGTGLRGVDRVVFYDKPFLKFERLVETYLTFAPRGFKSFRMAMPLWLREKLFLKGLLKDELGKLEGRDGWNEKLLFSEHHLSHAASAFFPSPFEEAVVLTMDGVGEWATTSAAIGKGSNLEVHKEIHFPHSLGFLYSAFTYYTGSKVNSGEYKLMGLAPYGVPRYKDRILEHLIDVKADGSFRLDLSYFNYCTGLTMTSDRFHKLFGGHPRRQDELLTDYHMDLAASIQAVTDEIVLRLTRSLRKETGIRNLCLAGGVALNCVENGTVLRDGGVEALNLKVNYRESFRPFAPSVLRERVNDWFEMDSDSPYMLLVADVVKSRRREMTAEEKQLFGIDKLNVPRSDIPAVTHVDYSARIQTVHEDTNPRYYALLSAFERKTGCPVIVNTSFNVRGEPIVCTPEDAFRCFMGNELDVLAVGNCYLRKEGQDSALKQNYETAFELD